MGVHPPQALAGAHARGPASSCRPRPTHVYVDHGVVDYAVNLVLATRAPGPLRPARARRAASPSAPAPAPASAWSPAPGPSPCCAAAPTPCPRTSSTSPPTCCATGSCCRYEALAQGLAVDQLLARLLSTVPAPRVAPSQDPAAATWPGGTRRPRPPHRLPARPGRRRRSARPVSQPRRRPSPRRARDRSDPTATAANAVAAALELAAANRPPSIADRPVGRGAAPPRADGHPPPRRHAAGRLPRPRARPRLRARARPGTYHPGDDVRRIDWNVTARIQEPHVRETIADRELETWVAGRPLGQPRLRHRRLREARPRRRRHRRRRLPHPAHRQPHRRRRARRRDGSTTVPARTGRIHLQALLHRVLDRARKADHPGASDLAGALARMAADHATARPRRRRLRLPRRRRRGTRPLRALGRPPRGAGHRGRRPPRARAARRRAARARRPRDRCNARGPDRRAQDAQHATPRPPPHSAPTSPAASAAPAPTTSCSAPTATGCSTSCGSSPGAASGSNPSRGCRP